MLRNRRNAYVNGLRRAERFGRSAFHNSEPLSANPYKRGDMRLSWVAGWEAEKLKATKAPPDAR